MVLRYVNESSATRKVGTTKVFLEADRICRARECNFGNLVTDAFVYAVSSLYLDILFVTFIFTTHRF